jgi:dihydropyrimidinase
MPVDTVITGGTLVTATDSFEGSIAFDDGTIVVVGSETSMPDASETVDASGLLVMPGIVDPHVHIEDHFSVDTYETGTSAAAAGGITTWIDFAWQHWVGELSNYDADGTLMDGLAEKQRKGQKALIDYSVHAALTREDPAVLDELETLVQEGVTSFKMFTAYEIGLGYGFMNRVLERLADLDAVGVFHTEDASVTAELTELFKAEGKGGPTWYPKSRPDYAEAMAANNAVRMAQEAGAKYYGIHTSCRKAADELAGFRDDGSMVRAETCTQYLTLDDTIYEELGNLPMMAPPIRKPDDNDAMFEHLRMGSLDVVSTDHCCYKRESKVGVDNWWECTFGANGLQTSLPVAHDEAVNRRGFSRSWLVRKMSTNPARIFGLPGKGTLDPGTDADVVLFDPTETYTIDPSENLCNTDFSIFEGREVTGRVKKTFVRGTLVAEDGRIVAEPGHGRFVERKLPDWDF